MSYFNNFSKCRSWVKDSFPKSHQDTIRMSHGPAYVPFYISGLWGLSPPSLIPLKCVAHLWPNPSSYSLCLCYNCISTLLNAPLYDEMLELSWCVSSTFRKARQALGVKRKLNGASFGSGCVRTPTWGCYAAFLLSPQIPSLYSERGMRSWQWRDFML